MFNDVLYLSFLSLFKKCYILLTCSSDLTVGWSSPTQQQTVSPKNWITFRNMICSQTYRPKKKKTKKTKETQRYELLQSFYRSIYLCQNSILLFPFNLYSDFFDHLILCAEHRQAWNITTAKSWLFIQSELVLQLSSHNWKTKW